MQNKIPLFQIPEPSTASATDAKLCDEVGGIVLRYDYYRDGIAFRSGIRFVKALATRTRAERCCTTWHIENAYDFLIEVTESPWVEELRRHTAPHWRHDQEMHHYMIYLDSVGCFEVVSESYEALSEEVGSWETT